MSGNEKKSGFMADLKSYFNSWAADPGKMAREDGAKIAAGAGISIVALWLMPFVGPTLLTTLIGGAIGSKPLRGRTGQAVLSLANEFAPNTVKKMLPPPPKKGPGDGPSAG